MATPVRRQADTGVHDALKSVVSNVKFKRMMVFGLKSLSDFCVPPTIKYKENSACVLTSEQFPTLLETPNNFKGDDDVLTLLGKIYWGVTEAALEDQRLSGTLQSLNFSQVIGDVIAGGIQDEKGLELYLGAVKNLNTLKVPVQSSMVAAGLINTLNIRMKTPQISNILSVLQSTVQDEAAVTELVKVDGCNKILSVLAKKTDIPPSTAVAALSICNAVYKQKQASGEDLDHVIELVDRFRDEKVVQNAGSAALSSMVSINDLKKCLATLQKSSGDSPEKAQALTTLSSMSYISSFAGEVVKAGGIGLLVEAVQQAAKTSMKGLIGASKMLQAVAANQAEKQKISDAGGLEALIEAAGTVIKSPQAIVAVLGALEPLVTIEENANKAATKTNILQVCVEAVRSHPKDQSVILACTRFFAAMAQKDGTLPSMKKAGILQVISGTCQTGGSAAAALAAASLKIAARLAAVSDSNEIIAATQGLCGCFLSQVDDVEVANSGCDFLSAASKTGDAAKRLAAETNNKAVDCVLSVMLEHIDTAPQLASRAREIIDVLATEQDVNRTLNELEVAINGARNNPVRCLRCLAAVNGLSQISRMAPIFEKKDAAKIIVAGLGKWIDGAKFEALQKIIRASCQCVEQLISSSGGSSEVDNILDRLLAVIQQPGLKSLRDSQDDVANNSLVDLCKLMEDITATQRFKDADSVAAHGEGILRIMRKYSDAKLAQVSCINALNNLAASSKEGAQKIVDSGALRSVLSYMNKVGMYEDVQVAGCRLMLTLAQTDPKIADYVKSTDALAIVTKACRTHRKSSRLNKYGTALLGLLIPEGELEKLIQENIREINRCVKLGDMAGITAAMKAINTAANSAEASRVAARCDLGRALQAAVDAAADKPQDPSSIAVMSETAVAAANLTQKHFGVTNLQKNGGVGMLVKMFENLSKVPNTEGQKELLTVMKRLLRKNKEDSEIFFKKGFVPKICRFAEEHQDDDPDLFVEAVGVMAAMKKTDALIKDTDFRRFIGNVCNKMNGECGPPMNANLAESMDALMIYADEDLIDLFISRKGLAAVYKLMDDYPNDGKLIRYCQNIVDTIAKKKNLREQIRKEIPAPFERVARVTKKILRVQDIDPDTAAITLSNLNKIVTPKESEILSDVDLIPEIERLMHDFPTHQPLILAAGEYLGKIGCDDQIRNLMKKIIDCCNAKPQGWESDLEKLNNKLAVYLVGKVNNPDKALKLSEPCMNALAGVSKQLIKNPAALTSIAKVSRRIARRSREDPNTPYGVPTLKTAMMKTMAELLASDCDNPQLRPRAFLIDGFHCLADCARHPDANSLAVEQGLTMGTIKHADLILKKYEGDPDVAAAILDYLGAVCSQPKTASTVIDALARNRKSRRIGEPQIVDDIVAMMKRFRMNPTLMDAALDALANMAKHGKVCPAILAEPAGVSELFGLGGDDPKVIASIARANRRVVGKVPVETSTVALQKIQAAYKGFQNDPSVSDADRALVACELAAFMEALADAGMVDVVKKLNGTDTLVELLEDNAGDLQAVARINRAMRRVAESDPDANAKLARLAVPVIMGIEPTLLTGDFEAAKETLNLLEVLAGPEGQGRLIGNSAGLAALMTCVHELAQDLPMHEALELERLEKQFRQCVEDDQPEHLTLELVYRKWSAAKEDGEVLLVEDNSLVIRYFDFVANYTEEYAKEKLDGPESGLGAEFVFGCLCYRLLHEQEENTRAVMDKNDEPKFFLHAMGAQKNDIICQNAVQAALSCLEWPDTADSWANSPNAAAISADVLQRSRKMKVSTADKEPYVIERLKLCEKLAVSRTYYNGTDCMAALIGLWDDYDSGKYTVAVLKGVFQSMRRIVNDHWVGIILKNNVPKRLVDVVNDVNAKVEVLPDVLFLLAALAVVPEIKSMIGDLKGVEACLGLLVRAFKSQQPMSAVLTNDCLALSAITMGHTGNLTRFIQAKGVELNIPAMDQQNKPNLDYDVANAASVLMCNNCFKRDELKQMYGNKGACQAVMRTIHKYDGKEDQKAFRCLGAMFKAIGNLALHTPNVQIFMAASIERTFAHLYEKSDRLPDQLVEGTLRTLSNLSMENTQENMRRFGVCLTPILYMLRQGQRSSVKMFTLAFDVLGLLCRLPSNSQKFLSEGGVPICLRILNQYEDSYLYANGIRVLGIQTTTPAAVGELIQHGVFDFLTSLLENQANAIQSETADHDLAVSGLRCIRRLLKSQSEARKFIEAGGLQQCIALMSVCPADVSMTHLETQRVVCNLLALFPPPQPTPQQRAAMAAKHRVDDEWDEDVADEGVLTGVELIDRPDGPRSWESIDLDAPLVSKMVEALCSVLSKPENIKQTRLGRCALGLLAYFACEKIPGTVESFYNGNALQILENVFEALEDTDTVKMGCYIINNVAYASAPEDYLQIRKCRTMRKNLDAACGKLSGETKSFCEMTLKLLNEKSADPTRFEIHQQWNFPLTMTWWDRDKYPMGVQDLPGEWKEELRAGGKFKTVVGGSNREVLFWKSSMDLTQIQWRIDSREGPMQHSLGVSRICSIGKGLKSEALIQANQQGSPTSKPRDGDSMVLRGLPCEEFPEGVELNIICTMKRQRDKFFDLLVEWREAAAFGF